MLILKIMRTDFKEYNYGGYNFLSYRFSKNEDFYDFENTVLATLKKKTNKSPKELDFKVHNSWNSAYNLGPHYNILFSGGADSLSLVLRHLEKKEKVVLFNIGFNEVEKQIATLTVNKLKSIYGDKYVYGLYDIFGQMYISNNESTIGLTQQPICAFYSIFIPDCYRENAIATEIAYCMNDDAISYLKELENIYYSAFEFKKCGEQQINVPPLKFPLTKVKHYKNVGFIYYVEEKYSTQFQFISGKLPFLNKIKIGEYIIYFINSEGKNSENKEDGPTGYITIRKPKYDTENLAILFRKSRIKIKMNSISRPIKSTVKSSRKEIIIDKDFEDDEKIEDPAEDIIDEDIYSEKAVEDEEIYCEKAIEDEDTGFEVL